MNKHAKKRDKGPWRYGKNASVQIMAQYALSLILYPLCCFVLFILAANAYNIYRRVTHDESSLIFWLAQIVRDTLGIWAILAAVAGWIILTWHFVCKPLRYLDEVVAAAEALSVPGETPISLNPDLQSIQDNLNLAREQALRSAATAKEAEQRKNDLVVYLAHDLKTPLTSVIGYLTLLTEEPQISAELRARYTGIALTKAQRLEDLIDEFFDITRFSLKALTPERSRIDLSRMLEQTVSEFFPVLSEKNLSWHTEIESNVELLCDPNKLARVFDNLIRNAVAYSYTGTEITLSMERLKEADNCYALVTIANHGKTIPPDKLERIFEQFFRLDSSRTSSTGGAGLGLAIAKEIVELHGGFIAAESREERIIFTVKLPL